MDRLKEGMTTGIVGLICNLGLSAFKFTIGAITASIAIQADAFNNLSDAVSSITSLAGFKMSGKSADSEHPFGHGRMEYLSGFIVSFLVVAVGLEFFKSSLERIIKPEPIIFSIIPFFLLILSVFVKLMMGLYYLKVSKKIGSMTVRASAVDSFSDCIITSVTIIALAVSQYTDLPIDGIAGIIVAVFILFSGVKLIKELLNPLIGSSPDNETVDKITSLLVSYDHILGIHDLLIHDYGPGKVIASVHAEISQEMSFLDAHSLTEAAESAILDKYGIKIVIHGDPVDVNSPEIQRVRFELKNVLRSIDESLAYHDLRLVPDSGHTDVVFDLVIPYSRGTDINGITDLVSEKLKNIDRKFDPKITVDRH